MKINDLLSPNAEDKLVSKKTVESKNSPKSSDGKNTRLTSVQDIVSIGGTRQTRFSFYSEKGEIVAKSASGLELQARTSTLRFEIELEIQQQTKTAYESKLKEF